MADGTTPIDIPKVTSQEALYGHNALKAKPTAEMTDIRIKDVVSLSGQTVDKLDFFQRVVNGDITQTFSSERTGSLAKSFGGGKTKTETDGTIGFDGNPNSPEQQLFDEAQRELNGLKTFQRYSELLTQAEQAGLSFDEFATKNNIDNYQDLKSQALDVLLNDVIYEANPELRVMPLDEIKDIVDLHLAQDPTFRAEVSGRLAKIKLPKTEIAENTEADVLNTKIGELDTQGARAVGEVETYLKSTIPDFDTKLSIDVKAKIEDYVKRGYSTEQILNELKFDLLPTKYFDKLTDYRSHEDEYKRLNETYQQLIKIDKTRNKDLYDSLNRSYTRDRNAWKTENAALTKDSKYTEFQNITNALSSTKDGARSEGRAAQRIQELVGVKNQKDEAVAKKSTAETTGNQVVSKNRDARLEEERAAIAELRGIIPKAIAKTLMDRADTMYTTRTQQERERFDKDTNDLIDKMRAEQKKRGRGYDTENADGRGKFKIDRNTIIGDARTLANRGDTGLRDIALELTGWVLKDEDGNPMEDADGYEIVPTYDQLSPEQKLMFDKVYAAEKQGLKVKIAKDLVSTYGFTDKIKDFTKLGFGDKNGLNDDEWEQFGKYTAESVRQIVGSTQEGQRAIQQLEAAGIKPESKRGIGILSLLGLLLGAPIAFAALGGIGAIGVGVTTGIGAIKGAA